MGPRTTDEARAEILREFPAFREVRKADSRLMKAISSFLKAVTLGGMSSFMDRYTTTIGTTVYTPEGWDSWDDASRCAILRHERVHMRQAARHGMLLFSVLYLLPLFPLGLAWFRARFEQEAYEESIAASLELRGSHSAMSPEFKERMVRQFTGPAYGYMWPFKGSVEKWFDDALDRKVRAFLKGEDK